jgi:rubrerythrin
MLITRKELAENLLNRDPDEKVYAIIWDKTDLMPDLPEDQEWTEAQITKVFDAFSIDENSWEAIGLDEQHARASLEEFRCETCYDFDLRTIQAGRDRECPLCGEEEEVV